MSCVLLTFHCGGQDDLAETSTYSPVIIEDPSLETAESFSDWEYYSDDFYDDDPTVFRRRRAKALQEAENQIDWPPRKKKRTASTTTDGIPQLSLPAAVVDLPTDTASFKGVIWRKPDGTEKQPDLYEPGQCKKVALFKDWREVFKASHCKSNWLRERSPYNRLHLAENGVHEITPLSQEDAVMDEEYALLMDPTSDRHYSPPPVSIDNLGKPPHEPKITKAQPLRTTSRLKEVMTVDDQLTNMATLFQSPEREEENANLEQTSPEKLEGFQQLLWVEIPAAPPPSSPMTPLQMTPKFRREKKRRASAAVEEEGSARKRKRVAKNTATVGAGKDNNSRRRLKTRVSATVEKRGLTTPCGGKNTALAAKGDSNRRRSARFSLSQEQSVSKEDITRRLSKRLSSSHEQKAVSNTGKRRRRRASSPGPLNLRRSTRIKTA